MLVVKIICNVMLFFDMQVDKHIRRLDADLARFENELKEKLEVGGYESTDGRAVKSELLAEKPPRVPVEQTCEKLCYSVFSTEGESRGLKEKRGSRGRGRKGSDDDSPKKKKMKTRYLRAAIPQSPFSCFTCVNLFMSAP